MHNLSRVKSLYNRTNRTQLNFLSHIVICSRDLQAQLEHPSTSTVSLKYHHKCNRNISPRKMHRTSSYLPIYLPHSGLNINDWHVPPQPRPGAEKCVHVIPVIVLLCFLILWWFSCPVNVELKDGRIAAIHQIEDMPLSLNDTHVELAVLASAMSPIASTPKNFTRDNETESTPGEEK